MMPTSLRTTAAVALSLALAAGAFGQTAPPVPDALLSGPMLAYADLRETAVWLQTRHAVDAQLRYFPEGRPADARLSPAVRTDVQDDFIAVFTLSELEPGTRYAYEVYLDGRPVARPYPFTFATQALWRWRTDAPDFTALFGSCAYVNDPAYDRPGTPYGSDHEIFAAMAAKKPDLMLWVGDNTYTREADFFSPGGIRYRYRHDRALPQLQELLAATHHYATWDDHDYGPNDSDGTFALKDVSLDVFRQYWPGVGYGLRGVPGVFQKFQWSDVDFFLVDDRYHRKPERWPDGADKTMLGRAQMDWLKESLAASRAPFKLVVVGSQALNPLSRSESWAQFETERTELLDFIRTARIEGVVFLSGDRHMSELIRIDRPGQYPLYDFTSSPLTAGTAAPRGPEQANPHRVAGTLLVEHSFGRLRFEGKPGARRLHLEAYDKAGNLKWEHVIAQGDLAFPKTDATPR